MRNKFSDEAADLDLTLVRPSEAAWLVRDGHGTEGWLPRSQVDFPDGVVAGSVVTVTVPNWLAEEKGLE